MLCTDRVALVTGAAGNGMGRSIALTLAREGAQVVVNYLTSEQQAHTIVDAIKAQGGDAVAVGADVFTADGCRHLVDATVERFGRVDICIISPGGEWVTDPVDRLNPADGLGCLQSEVGPFFYLMPLVLPGMYERRWGRIVGISADLGSSDESVTLLLSSGGW